MMISINKNMPGKPFPHMWSKCIGAGRACEGLRSKWQEQLREAVKECGFEYIRFHGLLAEDMFVCHEVNGQMQYNWYYIDSLYDFLLETGIRPIVEFGFMPPALASGEKTQFWWKGNITPPADYNQWKELIYQLVLHWKERYGLEEIRKWYYEVWNEPNLHVFWSGTKSQYFELYKTAVQAVKAVDPELRVGGPATSNFVPDDRFEGELEDFSKHRTHLVEDLESLSWQGVWIRDFLDFCARENLPVDFVSAHPYPTDFALDGQQVEKGRTRYVDSIKDDMEWIRSAVKASAYPDAEIHLTEWSSSPSSRDCSHDELPEADYIVKSNLECMGLADSLSYWVFTDIFEELGGGPEVFHGGFGLMNMHGIKKPSYHAYRMLHELGNEEIARGDAYVMTRTEDGKLRGIFYNYAKELKQTIPIFDYPDRQGAESIGELGFPENAELEISGLQPGALLKLERLNREHAATTLWKQMGYPKNLTLAQEKALKDLRPHQEYVQADEEGYIKLHLQIEPWEIVLIGEV